MSCCILSVTLMSSFLTLLQTTTINKAQSPLDALISFPFCSPRESGTFPPNNSSISSTRLSYPLVVHRIPQIYG
ncbi:hypothetical protein CPB85DRAFT_1320959 [Mucidula mucida]|nr:hypothetical protein CPB85DRAFT_1320959 [Mucidula mucida]